ncbi:MAG: hypothetical protein HRU18_06430 [Pseudoalteromonas sp.]|uniref:hypothetical protein n=1 Tax=Pseudoalteromonas sp. TaxID=53249 RepID=UPI001DC667CD|nr:hypothetical protein [Pseudoalteromonas sp.]NRA77826.1 hypothetical protein [Pseudoalteromonas sp.]
MKTLIATVTGLALLATPSLSQTTAGSDAVAGATNSLTIEGSYSSSVGSSNNTAPCQQVNSGGFWGGSVNESVTQGWCLAPIMAEKLVQVSRLPANEQRIAIHTLCAMSQEYREILIQLGKCVVRGQ